MIEVKLSFNTQAELVAFFTGRAAQQVIETTAAADIPAEIVKAAEPAKKTRTKKNADVPAVGGTEEAPAAVVPDQETTAEQAVEQQPEDAAAVSDKSYTVDDVRRALQDYVGRTDFATGTALVKSFGATRITELKAEDYAAFIAKTQEQVAA